MSLAVSFQIVISVVGPAGRPVLSDVAECLGQFSGHILHLVPGDYQYEPPQFTIVIGWNSVEHFFCTELASQDEVYEWKLALCHQFLNGAVDMYNETESQILEEDKVLVKAMQDLRDQMEVTSQLLHNRVKSRDATVPPVTVHSTRKTAMTKELKVDYVPVPLLRHQVREQNPADIPAKHAGGTALLQFFHPYCWAQLFLKRNFLFHLTSRNPANPAKDLLLKRKKRRRRKQLLPRNQGDQQDLPQKQDHKFLYLFHFLFLPHPNQSPLLLLFLGSLQRNLFAPNVVTPLTENMILTII